MDAFWIKTSLYAYYGGTWDLSRSVNEIWNAIYGKKCFISVSKALNYMHIARQNTIDGLEMAILHWYLMKQECRFDKYYNIRRNRQPETL